MFAVQLFILKDEDPALGGFRGGSRVSWSLGRVFQVGKDSGHESFAEFLPPASAEVQEIPCVVDSTYECSFKGVGSALQLADVWPEAPERRT